MSENNTERTITLGGIEYRIGRMTINQLCDIETAATTHAGSSIRLSSEVLSVALKRRYPDLDLSHIDVRADELKEALGVVLEVAGFKQAETQEA